jgi:dihydroorotase
VARLREAKRAGLKLTCDVAVHHVHLCDIDIGWFDAQCHLVPPLRGVRDRDALRAGLADGTIDAICSDHAPVDDDGKQLPFAEAEPGAIGLELLLPLTLKWAREASIALPAALARITTEPARVLGIDAGHLGLGAAADICIVALDEAWTVTRETLKSQGKNTPFLGLELAGRVRYTLVDGQIVYQSDAAAG